MGRLSSVLLVCCGLSLSCGGGDGSSMCGNGVQEAGEGCDDGNDVDDDNCTNSCRLNLPDSLNARVKWAFNKEAAPLFDADSCFDLGVSRVEVEIEHTSTNEVLMAGETCGFRQVTFTDLEPGDYVARLRPNDSEGVLMTTEVIETLFTIGTASVEVEVNVPPDKWKDDYMGHFFFRTHWGQMGVDCDGALPRVMRHELTLERGGVPVAQVTEQGDPLDGSDTGRCYSLDEEFPMSALDVPWGFYVFHIAGLDAMGTPQFQESFDTFVGAGVSNPEMQFVVTSLNPDAGVPDAGPPDGG